MKTLKDILRLAKEYIKNDEPITDDQVNQYLNMGIERFSSFCHHPDCRKRKAFKNWRGKKIHMAKVHGWTKEAEKDFIRRHWTNPSVKE